MEGPPSPKRKTTTPRFPWWNLVSMLPGSPFSLGLGAHSLTPCPFFWGAQARPLGGAQQVGGPCAWEGVVEVAAPPSASIHSPGWHPLLRCQSFGGLVPHQSPEEMNV